MDSLGIWFYLLSMDYIVFVRDWYFDVMVSTLYEVNKLTLHFFGFYFNVLNFCFGDFIF